MKIEARPHPQLADPEHDHAAPHRLPELRLRHAVWLHRPRHDHADASVTWRIWSACLPANPALPAIQGIRSTWFVPGFTIESYPKECEAVVQGGHEIGHHSWAHIPNASMSREEEEADLARAGEAIVRLTGKKAVGYRSPSWDLSSATIDLLIEHGFLYDSSMMGADYTPYLARRGDRAELGKPYHFGDATNLIELPISWSLDDHPHFEFMRTRETVVPGLQSARTVMQNWHDDSCTWPRRSTGEF